VIDLAELEIGLYIYSGTGRLLPHYIMMVIANVLSGGIHPEVHLLVTL